MLVLLAAVAVTATVGSVAVAADGAAVFKAQCAKCHGETGQADTAPGKALKTPALAGDAKVAGMALPDIVAAVKANKKHESFIKKLSDDDISAAAGYAKDLASKK
jgi:mono/diheme cytochrome c family protein